MKRNDKYPKATTLCKDRTNIPVLVPSSHCQGQRTCSSSRQEKVISREHWAGIRNVLPKMEMSEAGGEETGMQALLITAEC